MPENPEQEGSPRLMTISEIAEAHGVSRQTVHTYRRRGVFPKPVEGEGSTRPRFRSDEVADFFAANPKHPGRRTDLTPRPQRGGPMVYVVTLRVEADAELTPERIREAIYDAAEDVPFGFDVTSVEPEVSDG